MNKRPAKRTQVNDEFEEWCKKKFGHIPCFSDDGRYYVDYHESVCSGADNEWQHRWEGWKAAYARLT